MKYRRLGFSSLLVSEISIGCSGYWGNKQFNQQEALNIIYEAFDRGVNFFDTGRNYSNFNAEPRLGLALSQILSSHDRSKLVISSKAGSLKGSSLQVRLGVDQDFSPQSIENSCYQSIKSLGCGYLDIFQLHGPSIDSFTPDLLIRLGRMKELGMYNYLGVNTHDLKVMEYIASNPGVCDMVLVDYNCLQIDREPIIENLYHSGCGIVAGTILAQGHLVSKKIGSIRSGSFLWYLARSYLKPSSRYLATSAPKLRKLLQSVKYASPAQAAFAFTLANPLISSCVFGTTRLVNLLDVLDSVDVCLDESLHTQIRSLYMEHAANILG